MYIVDLAHAHWLRTCIIIIQGLYALFSTFDPLHLAPFESVILSHKWSRPVGSESLNVVTTSLVALRDATSNLLDLMFMTLLRGYWTRNT